MLGSRVLSALAVRVEADPFANRILSVMHVTCETKSKSSPGPTTLSQACQASGTWGSSHWPLTGHDRAHYAQTDILWPL